MAIQCADTETLVQTFLDGELAEQDSAMLEGHLAACSECERLATDAARMHAHIREKLAPPPAPAHLHDQVLLALEREDWQTRSAGASRWNWTLPAAASVAAAAALLFFVVSNNTALESPAMAEDAVRQHMGQLPIEATGASAVPFVREYVSQRAHIPRFSDTATDPLGVRLASINGRIAAHARYKTRVGRRTYNVSVLIFDARGLTICSGRVFRMGGREVCLSSRGDYHIAAHKDDDGIGYIFISDMNHETMLEFVKTSDLLLRASEMRGFGSL